MNAGSITFDEVQPGDFEELAELRIEAMRESLERAGRFDPQRARERLLRSFNPEHTRWILMDGMRVGFFALVAGEDGMKLDHLYIRPGWQSRGIGTEVMDRLKALAKERAVPIHVTALRESAANGFYQRHGFAQSGEGEWDIHYVRLP